MTAKSPSLKIVDERIPAIFLERPNRYLGKVRLGRQEVSAFIPNPGRMTELMVPGRRVLLRPAPSTQHRKTEFDLVAVKYQKRFVLIDSGIPNRFLKYLLKHQLVPETRGWHLERSEWKWGTSQFDFLLKKGDRLGFLEAKCCTLVENGVARFPDAPTARGTRHVRELTDASNQGYRSIVMILVQGVGAERFEPNRKTDPQFSDALNRAVRSGVEVYVRVLRFSGKRIYFEQSLPVRTDIRDIVA